jgi:hypothetical protein
VVSREHSWHLATVGHPRDVILAGGGTPLLETAHGGEGFGGRRRCGSRVTRVEWRGEGDGPGPAPIRTWPRPEHPTNPAESVCPPCSEESVEGGGRRLTCGSRGPEAERGWRTGSTQQSHARPRGGGRVADRAPVCRHGVKVAMGCPRGREWEWARMVVRRPRKAFALFYLFPILFSLFLNSIWITNFEFKLGPNLFSNHIVKLKYKFWKYNYIIYIFISFLFFSFSKTLFLV